MEKKRETQKSPVYLSASKEIWTDAHITLPINEIQKIRFWASQNSNEVGGLGTIKEIREKGRVVSLVVDQVFLIEQAVGGAHTALDDEGVVKLLATIPEGDQERLVFWWHTHPGMSVFWSSQDQKCIEDFRPEKYMVSMVFNTKDEFLARLDLFRPYHVTVEEIPVFIDISNSDKESVKDWLYESLLENGGITPYSVLNSFDFTEEVEKSLKSEFDKKVRIGSNPLHVSPPKTTFGERDWRASFAYYDDFDNFNAGVSVYDKKPERESKPPLTFHPNPNKMLSKKERKKLNIFKSSLKDKMAYEVVDLLGTIFPIHQLESLFTTKRPYAMDSDTSATYMLLLEDMFMSKEIPEAVYRSEKEWAEAVTSEHTFGNGDYIDQWVEELWDDPEALKGKLLVSAQNWPTVCAIVEDLYTRKYKGHNQYADIVLAVMMMTSIYKPSKEEIRTSAEMEV